MRGYLHSKNWNISVLAIIVVVLVIVSFLFKGKMTENNDGGEVVLDPTASHFCTVEPFSKVVLPGETSEYEIFLSIPDRETKFSFLVGAPKDGIVIDPVFREGKSVPESIAIEVIVDQDAEKTSMNIPIIFTKKGFYRESSTACQFNVVIQ